MRSHKAYLKHGAFGEDELTNTFQKCQRFVEFCDKYDICEAASDASSQIGRCIPSLSWEVTKPLVVFCYSRLHEHNLLMLAISEFPAKKLLDGEVNCYEELNELMEDNNIAGPITRSFLSTTVVHKNRRLLWNEDEEYEE